MKPNLYLGGAIAVIILLLVLNINACMRSNSQHALISAYTDTLRTVRNEKGQQTASIQTLQGTVSDLQELKTSKDSTINWLRKVLKGKDRTIAAMVLSNNTRSEGSSKSAVSFEKPKFKPGIRYVYPAYKTEWSDEWSHGSIKATKDSIFRNVVLYNKFELKNVVHGGLFKKSTVESSVLNLNPHTETTELRTFQIECKCNKGAWFGIGTGVGAAAMYFLKR